MPTLTLQPDATGLKQAELSSANPDSNTVDGLNFYIGENNSAVNTTRVLLQFDLSGLPADATVDSATLTLFCDQDRSSNIRTCRVFRLKREWVEAEVTWNVYSTGNAWSTAGGFGVNDCEQTDIGNRSFAAAGESPAFKDWTLTATTKADLDYGIENGGNQTGWLLKMDVETDDAWRFRGDTAVTTTDRPKLVIEYTEAAGGAILKHPGMTAGMQQLSGGMRG